MLAVPPTPQPNMGVIRPFEVRDEAAVYDVCRSTYFDSRENADFSNHADLIPDRLVGALLTVSPDHCFVMEEDGVVCGSVVAALDARAFHKKVEIAWLPVMQQKYARAIPGKPLSPQEEFIESFHDYKPVLCEDVLKMYPSLLRANLLPKCKDVSAARRILACAIAALKANGSHGIHVELLHGESCTALMEFYAKLGFFSVPVADHPVEGVVVLGRAI